MDVNLIKSQDYQYTTPLSGNQEVVGSLLNSEIMQELGFLNGEEIQKVLHIAVHTPLENGVMLIDIEGSGRLAFVDKESIVFTNSNEPMASGAFAQMHYAVVLNRTDETIDEVGNLFRRDVDMTKVPPHKLDMYEHSYQQEAMSQTSHDYQMRSDLKGTPNVQDPPKKVMVLNGTGIGNVGSLEKQYLMEWGDYVQDEDNSFTQEQKKSQIDDVVKGYGGCAAKDVIVSDIKPDNCLVDETGKVVISDLGGARKESQLELKFKAARRVFSEESDPNIKDKVFANLVGTRNIAFSRDAQTRALLEASLISGDYDAFREIIEKSDVHAMGVSFVYLYAEGQEIEGESLFSCVVHSNYPEYANEGVGLNSVVSEDLSETEAQAKYKQLAENEVIPALKEKFQNLGFTEVQADVLSRTVHPQMDKVPTMLEVYETLGNKLESVNLSLKNVIDFAIRHKCTTFDETVKMYQEKKGLKNEEGVKEAFKKALDVTSGDGESEFKMAMTARKETPV